MPTPGSSQIPNTTSPVKQRQNPLNTAMNPTNGKGNGDAAGAGPSKWDYTENAPQGVVDAIAIERAREEKEGPPDMISGSLGSWGVEEGELSYIVLLDMDNVLMRRQEDSSFLARRLEHRCNPALVETLSLQGSLVSSPDPTEPHHVARRCLHATQTRTIGVSRHRPTTTCTPLPRVYSPPTLKMRMVGVASRSTEVKLHSSHRLT